MRFIELVTAGLCGGLCTMFISAIVIVVLAVRSKRAAPEKINYEALWRDPDVRLLSGDATADVPPRYDGMR